MTADISPVLDTITAVLSVLTFAELVALLVLRNR